MRFLLDMGLGLAVAEWLRQQGHDATHLSEEGLQELDDDEILAKCRDENRVLLTYDLDFPEIVALAGTQVTSVIVFRLNNAKTAFVIRRLTAILPPIEQALAQVAIVTIDDARYRVRSYPFGPNLSAP